MIYKIFFIYLFLSSALLAQWQPLFPYPTTDWIRWIEASSDLNYFIFTRQNDNSPLSNEIFTTSDGGENWLSIYKDKGHGVYKVYFLNSEQGWTISDYPDKTISKTTDGGYSWKFIHTLPPDSVYFSLCFINKDVGFISGNFHILKSTDGGESWDILYTDSIGGFFRLSVVSEQFIAAAGSGRVRITTNGGSSWSLYSDSTLSTYGLSGIYFLDSLNGFAMHNHIIVLKTTDGGKNWIRIIDENNSSYTYTVSEFYNNTGVIGFGYWGDFHTLFITTDRGETWIEKEIEVYAQSISFINDSTFLVAGLNGRMAKTTDYGSTFTFLGKQRLDGIKGYSFTKKDYGYLLSDYNYIQHTTDNGGSFTKIMCPWGYNSNMGANGDSLLYVSGAFPGKIYRSTNKGADWDSTILSPHASFTYQFSLPTERTGYHTTSSGIYKTIDGGENWFLISDLVQRGIFFLDSATGYLARGNVYKTTDGGVSWLDQGYAESGQIHFLNYEIGATGNNNLYYTHNGGNSWHQSVVYGDPEGIYSIKVFNHKGRVIAYASFSSRELYYSLDSCRTWRKDDYYIPDKVHYLIYNEGTLFAATEQGYLYKRENFDSLLTSTADTTNNILPSEYNLFQNYPNPFNPSTIISFSIPTGMNKVKLSIYDILGNQIAVLVNEEKPAGEYQVEWNASAYSSGVYFYRLHAGEFTSTKKLLLMK